MTEFATLLSHSSAAAVSRPVDWPSALGMLRDAGARINQLGPDTSLREALHLIAETAIALIGADPADRASAVIYTYDAAAGAFDAASRVSAGEGDAPLVGDLPRPNGMGATALARRARVLSYEETHLSFHPLKFQAGMRTSACYPLLVGGLPVGALYIALHTRRRFSEEELLLLDTFVHLAAVAIFNTRQYEGMTRALQRKVDQLERLQHADRLISSRRSLDETLREILNAALNLTGAEHGSLRLRARLNTSPPREAPTNACVGRDEVLRLRALVGGDLQRLVPETLPIDEGSVVGWVARHRQPACIADLHEAPWSGIYRPLTEQREMRAELAVPLLGPGAGLIGVLNVESPRVGAFDAEARSVLEGLGTQATIVIQEAKLLDAIEAVTERLALGSPDEVFSLLLERACDLLHASQAVIWELVPDAEPTLVLRADYGDSPQRPPERYRVPVHGSLLGTAVLTGQPVFSTDLANDPRLSRRDLAERMGWAAALIVPLTARDGTPRGALGVYTVEAREFSDWDARLLTCLANHAVLSLQLAQAVAQARAAEERQAVAETFAVLGDISANLLHRVNNLIGVIPVKLQGLADKRPDLLADTYVAGVLREVETSARAAMEVARETVVYLRPVRLLPTSVAACFEAALKRVSVPPHVRITARGLADLPPVVGGEEQVRLVLFNLIENALDALSDEPGRIRVSGRVVGGPSPAQSWVEIAVADSGPGVPPEHHARIFDPAFSTKRSPKKLGFGLWWVRTWVQRCGGSIELADQAGPGCTFVMRLPAVDGMTKEDGLVTREA